MQKWMELNRRRKNMRMPLALCQAAVFAALLAFLLPLPASAAVKKNASDVALIQKILKEQKGRGDMEPEDLECLEMLDDLDGSCYGIKNVNLRRKSDHGPRRK